MNPKLERAFKILGELYIGRVNSRFVTHEDFFLGSNRKPSTREVPPCPD